jgi:hypothetical protein
VALVRNGKGTRVILLRAPEENANQPITEKPRTLLETKYFVDQIRVSPDGTRVAYTSLGKRITGDLGGRIPFLHRPAQGRSGE